MPESPAHLAAIILVTALASFVQGYSGFGIGIVCMATLSYLVPDLERLAALAMLLALSVLVAFLVLSRSRGPVQWRQVGLMIPGVMVGVPLGYWFIVAFSEQPVARLCLGIVLCAFAVQGLLMRRVDRTVPRVLAAPAGILGGLLAGAFSTGGPPLVLYLYAQRGDPREMKSSVVASLLVLTLCRTALTGVTGGITSELVWMALLCLPGVLVLLFVGHWLSARTAVATFRRVVYGLIGLSGIILAAKAVAMML